MSIKNQPGNLVEFVRNQRLLKNNRNGTSARQSCAATRSSADAAATPANSSPDRRGVALAISSRNEPNSCVRAPTVQFQRAI